MSKVISFLTILLFFFILGVTQAHAQATPGDQTCNPNHQCIPAVDGITPRYGPYLCRDTAGAQKNCCATGTIRVYSAGTYTDPVLGTTFPNAVVTCETSEEPDDTDPDITAPNQGLTAETLDSLNPLKQYSQGVEEDLSRPGGIISRLLRFAFPLAGIVLFVMLIWSGFEIFTGATSGKKSLDAGKQRATAAVIGFFLLFVSYWLAQILEVIFGITIF